MKSANKHVQLYNCDTGTFPIFYLLILGEERNDTSHNYLFHICGHESTLACTVLHQDLNF